MCKWNKNISKYCSYCHEVESTEHLLYSCSRIKNIWVLFSNILLVDVRWKHIILGFSQNCETTQFRNIVLSIIVRCIFVERVKCYNNTNDDYREINLISCVKKALYLNKKICEYSTENGKWINRFDKIIAKIIDL